MISNSVMVSMIVTIVLAAAGIFVPFVMIYITARKKETGSFASFGLGILAYFWSQYLLPFPIIYIKMKFKGFMTIFSNDRYYVVYILITALLLGVLGTLGRLWCVWLMNKRTPSVYRAMCSGIGFAVFGAGSIVLSYITYFKYSGLINSGGAAALSDYLKTGNAYVTQDSIDNVVSQLQQARVTDITFEGINVVMVIVVEIAFAAFIYEGLIRNKKWKAAAVCACINTVYSFLTMLLSSLSQDKMGNLVSKTVGSVIYNGYMLICGLVAAWFVYGALIRYRQAVKEGPYAQKAYFEKMDEAEKIKGLL